MIDVSGEVRLQTTRSGGKGGQNVNKVETAVIASFPIGASQLLSGEQKETVRHKLANRINAQDELQVKSQTHRTQLANKEEALEKINKLITQALHKKKLRLATKPSKASKERRIENKKRSAQVKEGRRKLRPGHY